MTFRFIGYDLSDGIATVTLNNPEHRNALNPVMEQELRSALQAASDDNDVHAIVLTGAGHSFCVGGDVGNLQAGNLNELASMPPPSKPQSANIEENYARRLTYILNIRKPLFAAINGAVAGGGLNLVLYCDFRYMVDTAKLTTSFARRGLVAEQGIAWILPRLIGPMNALDLLLSARVVTGAQAAQLGLVRALPADGFLARVTESAREISALSSPRSTAIIRRQVYDGMFQNLAEACYAAELAERKSFTSEDFVEGIAHFVEKRNPRFTGR